MTRSGSRRCATRSASRGVKCVGIGRRARRRRTSRERPSSSGRRHATRVGSTQSWSARGTGSGSSSAGETWQQVLEEHAGIADAIRSDVAWVRAVSDHAGESGRPMRIATVTDATTSGGRSRAQTAAQLPPRRSPRGGRPYRRVRNRCRDRRRFALLRPSASSSVTWSAPTTAGACPAPSWSATAEWVGLRSHPHPEASISFGGPEVPSWVDGTLRDIVNSSERSRA